MATDYFLKLTDIDGESQDSKHTNEIDIESFYWRVSQPGASGIAGGSGTGRAQIHDFEFTARQCKASPKLMQACADGSHIASAVLTIRKAGKEQQEYSVYTMSDCIVAEYLVTSPDEANTSIPVDKFKLNFSKIEHQYKEQKPDGTLGGSVKGGWDVKQNKVV